jgi:hypothetical protein
MLTVQAYTHNTALILTPTTTRLHRGTRPLCDREPPLPMAYLGTCQRAWACLWAWACLPSAWQHLPTSANDNDKERLVVVALQAKPNRTTFRCTRIIVAGAQPCSGRHLQQLLPAQSPCLGCLLRK